jgi:hypothetical protein
MTNQRDYLAAMLICASVASCSLLALAMCAVVLVFR